MTQTGSITVRELIPPAGEVLEQINALLGQLSDKLRPLTWQQLHTVVAAPSTRIYAAYDDNCIVGMVTLVIAVQLSGTMASVEDVVVDEAYREHGIARMLMERAIREVPPGTESISLTSNPTRIAAHHLYRSLGFETVETNVFRLKL